MKRTSGTGLTLLLGLCFLLSQTALAQYTMTDLTSNQNGGANYTDPLLVNPWGLAYGTTSPFWVSDEGSGWSTLYNGSGEPQSLQVTIPPASGMGQGTPTGIAYNASQEFQINSSASVFLFATHDGTIQGWSSSNPTTAVIAVDNQSSGAVYTGLGITSKSSGNYLYAADFANNQVDIYDGSFNFVKAFTDPQVPQGFATFNVQDINGQLYVSFASTNGGPGGYVDIFNEDGTLVRRLIHAKELNSPWGFAIAPANFGPLSKTLLVSNSNTSGTINTFDPKTGQLLGAVTSGGIPLVIDEPRGIRFGGGSSSNGNTRTLYLTAGPNGGANGLFAAVDANKPKCALKVLTKQPICGELELELQKDCPDGDYYTTVSPKYVKFNYFKKNTPTFTTKFSIDRQNSEDPYYVYTTLEKDKTIEGIAEFKVKCPE